MILRSLSMKSTGGARLTDCSRLPAPTSTVVPPLRVDQMHVSIAAARPDRVERVVDSDTTRERVTRAVTSSAVGSITSVAPKRSAESRRARRRDPRR